MLPRLSVHAIQFHGLRRLSLYQPTSLPALARLLQSQASPSSEKPKPTAASLAGVFAGFAAIGILIHDYRTGFMFWDSPGRGAMEPNVAASDLSALPPEAPPAPIRKTVRMAASPSAGEHHPSHAAEQHAPTHSPSSATASRASSHTPTQASSMMGMMAASVAEASGDAMQQDSASSATEEEGDDASSAQQDGASVQGPWIMDEEMELVVHRRAVSKNRLVAYIDSMHQRMAALAGEAQMMGRRGQEWFNEELAKLEPMVDLQAQIIIFGVDTPNARKSYLEQYGCSRWTLEALQTIKSFGRIVEIGAGHGHWQRALTEIGADVVAYDDRSAMPVPGMPDIGKVEDGDASALRKHRNRTLLLAYPGPNDMVNKCLKEYKGRTLLYVGEPQGGVNGNTDFFNELQKEWLCEKVVPLDPFPDGYESLYILKRKSASRWLPRLW